jgi:hypothetical protein
MLSAIAGGGEPDDHRRRNQPVGHQLPELEPGGGRREGADAERVEEVDNRADADRFGTRSDPFGGSGADERKKIDRHRESDWNEERDQHGECALGMDVTWKQKSPPVGGRAIE